MGLRLQAAESVLHDPGPSVAQQLFAFEEMTTLSDEARILSLPRLGKRSLAANSWIDIAGKRSSVFALLAAHPRLLRAAHMKINAPARATLQRIWVGHSDDASPGTGAIVAPASGQATAVICLAGEAGLLHSGSVVWLQEGESLVLHATAAPLMLCAISYSADAAPFAADRLPVADDSLWPSPFVMAG
jgi:hypothetical protein